MRKVTSVTIDKNTWISIQGEYGYTEFEFNFEDTSENELIITLDKNSMRDLLEKIAHLYAYDEDKDEIVVDI